MRKISDTPDHLNFEAVAHRRLTGEPTILARYRWISSDEIRRNNPRTQYARKGSQNASPSLPALVIDVSHRVANPDSCDPVALRTNFVRCASEIRTHNLADVTADEIRRQSLGVGRAKGAAFHSLPCANEFRPHTAQSCAHEKRVRISSAQTGRSD